jgi:hypothetical protein
MARKQDSRDDSQALALLAQLNSKTVSNPTDLTGDNTPASVPTVTDFDSLRNGIHLSYENVEALNLLNSLGRITNLTSGSGVIVGTPQVIKITDTDGTGNPEGIIHQPATGEIWTLIAGQTGTMNADKCLLRLKDEDNSQTIELDNATAGTAKFTGLDKEIFYDSRCYLDYKFNTATGDCIVKVAVARVR